MSSTKNSLTAVLASVVEQKKQLWVGIGQLEVQARAEDSDVDGAIDLLIEKIGDVKVIGQIIGARLQLSQLKKMDAEIEVLIAALKVSVNDDAIVTKIVQQITADVLREKATNREAANS